METSFRGCLFFMNERRYMNSVIRVPTLSVSVQIPIFFAPSVHKSFVSCTDALFDANKSVAYILLSQKGTVFTIQRINVILKEIKKKYRLKVKNFSCHSLRKTFGRQVYNMNSENSELALVKLMELFNHSSIAITKLYLGLRQEEILETYDCLTF